MKEFISTNRTFKLLLLGIIISTFYFQVNQKWTNENHKTIIFSDALGYYAYLPAVFIYHDMNFGFQETYENKYYEPGKRAIFCNEIDGKKTDKYFSGVSVMMIPFFLLACLFSKIFGYDVDGYSYFFQVSVGVAALFYLIVGFIFLRKLLLYYCNERTSIFILLAYFFGTDLLHYTWEEPGMSHVYSFAAVSAFLYFSKLALSTHEKRDIFKTAFFYGLVILLRPTNAVIILAFPFLAGDIANLKQFFNFLFASAKTFISAFIICFSVVFIQLLIFYLMCGHWFVYSYTHEKFDFAHPEIMNVLFSYRKGLFIYTPLAFISLFGIFVLLRKNRFNFLIMLLVLGASTWIISSWWCWWYGGSYGNRAFVEYFPLFAVLLAIFYDAISNSLGKMGLSVLVLICISLNLFQTWQFNHNILPYDGITKEKYWNLFLRSNDRYMGIYGDNFFIPKEMDGEKIVVFKSDLESNKDLLDTTTVTDEKAFSGKHSSKIGGDVDKSVSFNKKFGEIFPKLSTDSNYYIQVKFKAYLGSLGSDAKIVISLENKQTAYLWQPYYVAHQVAEENKWTDCVSNVMIPKNAAPEDMLRIYVFKENSYTLYMDDLEIDLIKTK